jgi:CheY-like chemotaxis protein
MAVMPAAFAQRPQSNRNEIDVMVVDPQAESRSLLKAALRSISAVDSIQETGTLANVLTMLSDHPADVLFVEEELGWDNVSALVPRVKSLPACSKTNFVLMSGSLDMESRRQGMSTGILGYLAKPFDIKSLEAAIRDARGKVSTNLKETLDRVRRIDFFGEFADMELVRLLKICHTRKFGKGDTIFTEGEIGDRFYIVLSGQVEILKHRKERMESLAMVKAGETFGEMSIVDLEPRSADARAASDASMIEVNAEIIKDVNDILALKIYRKLAILVTRKLRTYTMQAEAE